MAKDPASGDEPGDEPADTSAAAHEGEPSGAPEPGTTEAGAATAEPVETQPVYRGTGISVALVVGILLAVVAVIIIVQNTDDVTLSFLTWDIEIPLVGIILVAALAGVLIDEILGLFWRRYRRRQLSERAELRRLRRQGAAKNKS